MGESVRERVTYRDATHKKPIHIHPLSAMIVLMVWTVFWSKWAGWYAWWWLAVFCVLEHIAGWSGICSLSTCHHHLILISNLSALRITGSKGGLQKIVVNEKKTSAPRSDMRSAS